MKLQAIHDQYISASACIAQQTIFISVSEELKQEASWNKTLKGYEQNVLSNTEHFVKLAVPFLRMQIQNYLILIVDQLPVFKSSVGMLWPMGVARNFKIYINMGDEKVVTAKPYKEQ
jgi:hypothetical protein